MTRIMIVEDHPVFRDGLAALLGSVPDMEVVALVADGPEAFEALTRHDVDVVLMDLNLPTTSGVDITERIVSESSETKVLVVTMDDTDETILAALRAGANGYVLKGSPGAEIVAAVRTVASGGAVFGAGVASQVLTISAARPRVAAKSPDEGLTQRERDVLELLALGASNVEIARNLGLTLKTVQNYVSRILDKLQVADRTQAALRARDSRGS